MTSSAHARQALAERSGLLRRKDHPELVTSLDWLVRSGELQSVLPGVLASTGMADDFETRVRAIQAWQPDAVLPGYAAARLTYWPEAPVTEVDVHAGRAPAATDWLRVHRSRPPAGWLLERGLRVTHPAWASVWLAAQDDGRAIDEALRRGAVSLDQLEAALDEMPVGRGHRQRRAVVEASRDNPWSQLERRLHAFLRRHGFGSWSANQRIVVNGQVLVPDVAFDDVPLVIEAMSWTFHGNQQAFLRDNRRMANLIAAGWVYLPVTWDMLDDEATLLRLVRAAHRQARRVKAAGAGPRTLRSAPPMPAQGPGSPPLAPSVRKTGNPLPRSA